MTARSKAGLSLLLMTMGAVVALGEGKGVRPGREAKLSVHALPPEGSAGQLSLERLGPNQLERQLDQLELELRSPDPTFPAAAPSPSPALGGRAGDSSSHLPDPAGTSSGTNPGSLRGS